MDKELSSTTRSKLRFTGKVRLCIARYRYVNTTHNYCMFTYIPLYSKLRRSFGVLDRSCYDYVLSLTVLGCGLKDDSVFLSLEKITCQHKKIIGILRAQIVETDPAFSVQAVLSSHIQ